MSPDVQAILARIVDGLVTQATLCVGLVLLLLGLSRRFRQSAFYQWWTLAWSCFIIFLLSAAASLTTVMRAAPGARRLLLATSIGAGCLHGVLLVVGARTLRPGPRRLPPWGLAALVLACFGLGLLTVDFSMTVADRGIGATIRALPRQFAQGLAFAWAAYLIFKVRDRLGRLAGGVLVSVLAIWAVMQVALGFTGGAVVLAHAGLTPPVPPEVTVFAVTVFAYFDVTWIAGIGVGLVLGVVEEFDRNNQALQRVTDQYRTLVDASPVAILALDRDGRVEQANAAARTLFAWDRGLPPRPPAPVDEGGRSPWARVLAGEAVANVPVRFDRPDGLQLNASVSAAPLHDGRGEVAGAIGVVVDVTERQRLEEAVRHAQKMEAVGRLAGGIAHDFNNVLTAVIGSLHLAADELPREHPATASVDEARDAARRAADLTSRLLAFSRRERRARTPLDVDAVIGDLQRLLRRVVDEHIVLEVELAGSLPLVVADRGELEQVLTNLAVNARDSMQERGGTLRIGTALVELAHPLTGLLPPAAAGRFVRIDVADSGTGMDAATLSRMFEPFYTTKMPGKGTGLGLATVYAILEEMGGQLRVDSTPGVGTMFSLFLRAA